MLVELDSNVMGQVNVILIYLLLFAQHRIANPKTKGTDRRSRRKFKMRRPPTLRRSSRISYHSLLFLRESLRDISFREVVPLPMILSLANALSPPLRSSLIRGFRSSSDTGDKKNTEAGSDLVGNKKRKKKAERA